MPCAERCDGAGRLLAAAVKGVNNGLHSRAAALLECLLQEDVLTPAHFKSQAISHPAIPAAKVRNASRTVKLVDMMLQE